MMMRGLTQSSEYSIHLWIWTLFCGVAGGVFCVYVLASLAGGQGKLLMPLDDVYIHFQYARQLALGQPYVYNPGQPPTSGATSFLYPFILAFGYLIGFQGLNLGLWAMLVGALALLASMQAIYRLCRVMNAPQWLSIFIAVLFAVNGSVSWHSMSGMETGLMCCFTLWTLYAVMQQQPRHFIVFATALALIRPEGSVMAVMASGVMMLRVWHQNPASMRPKIQKIAPLFIPILALGLQPLVNWLITGSAVASGNQSKSILGMVPLIPEVVIDRIWTNFTRLWLELLNGAQGDIIYLPLLLGILPLVALGLLLLKKQYRGIGFLILLWMISVSAAVSTLDTAFWHFKRYQMPLMALAFPLSGWLLAHVWEVIKNSRRRYSLALLALVIFGLMIPQSFQQFLFFYALNVNYVYQQPYQMARWLQANTPEDATVAVHDTGMMRYMGGRTTLDIVGLTTPNAAEYWRNGPGSAAEFIMREQPDYIASYGRGHGYGLVLLANTSLYGEPLAAFPVNLQQEYNVALAADFQGIYQPDYVSQQFREQALQTTIQNYLTDFRLVDSLNVGDILSEKAHAYTWSNSRAPEGFPTDVLEATYLDCVENCLLRDGGRRINGEERFTVAVTPGEDVLLITRVNPMHRVEYNVYADGEFVGTRFLPQERGRWLEVPTLIPAELVKDELLTIRIKINSDTGDYLPYYHLIYQGHYVPDTPQNAPLITWQAGAIALIGLSSQIQGQQLIIDLMWFTPTGARSDTKIFAHLYPDLSSHFVAQTDVRPGNNALSPGNWLPGTLHDTIVVNLADVPPGIYLPAIGLYDPVTFERLHVVSLDDRFTAHPDGRITWGEVVVP
jgi:hypothetical protein